MNLRARLATAIVLLFLVAPCASVRAGLIFVSNRADLGGTDYVDWSQLGPDGTTITKMFSASSNNGMGVDVTLVDRAPPSGTFGTATRKVNTLAGSASLFDSWGKAVETSVQIPAWVEFRFDFDQPLTAVGTDFRGVASAFRGTVVDASAFVRFLDPSGSLLLEHSLTSTESLVSRVTFDSGFVGARSDTANIAAFVLRIDATLQGGASHGVIAEVNRIDLEAEASSVPEPSSAMLLGLGGFACVGHVLRRRMTASGGAARSSH